MFGEKLNQVWDKNIKTGHPIAWVARFSEKNFGSIIFGKTHAHITPKKQSAYFSTTNFFAMTPFGVLMFKKYMPFEKPVRSIWYC